MYDIVVFHFLFDYSQYNPNITLYNIVGAKGL